MKIEKINDNQIRFIITREDLNERHLNVSELAYGSDKARAFFRDLMQQAFDECGFEADDIPLMIEAIPSPHESLILLVTKVDDPEELDARFSSFTPSKSQEAPVITPSSSADEILSCFEHLEHLLSKIGEATAENSVKKNEDKTEDIPDSVPDNSDVIAEAQSQMARIYAFDKLALLRKLAVVLIPFYSGRNSLYKDPKTGYYYLVLHMSEHTPAEFNKVCNIVAEYGEPAHTTYATTSYFDEHFTPVLTDDALSALAKLN